MTPRQRHAITVTHYKAYCHSDAAAHLSPHAAAATPTTTPAARPATPHFPSEGQFSYARHFHCFDITPRQRATTLHSATRQHFSWRRRRHQMIDQLRASGFAGIIFRRADDMVRDAALEIENASRWIALLLWWFDAASGLPAAGHRAWAYWHIFSTKHVIGIFIWCCFIVLH